MISQCLYMTESSCLNLFYNSVLSSLCTRSKQVNTVVRELKAKMIKVLSNGHSKQGEFILT